MLQKTPAHILSRIYQQENESKDWFMGHVKWFDRERKFGFIYPDEMINGHDEVFLPWTRAQDSNIRSIALRQGTRVRFTWMPAEDTRRGGRPEVVRITLVHDGR